MADHTLGVAANGKVLVDGVEIAGNTIRYYTSDAFESLALEDETGAELFPVTAFGDIENGITSLPFADAAQLFDFIQTYFKAPPVVEAPPFVLETVGSSGPATFEDGILNVPDYSSAASVTTVPGPAYTLLSSDKIVRFTNEGVVTLTVPAGLGAGFRCVIIQEGAGQVTFAPDGTTIHNRESFTKTAGQYARAELLSTAANIFVSAGDMAL